MFEAMNELAAERMQRNDLIQHNDEDEEDEMEEDEYEVWTIFLTWNFMVFLNRLYVHVARPKTR